MEKLFEGNGILENEFFNIQVPIKLLLKPNNVEFYSEIDKKVLINKLSLKEQLDSFKWMTTSKLKDLNLIYETPKNSEEIKLENYNSCNVIIYEIKNLNNDKIRLTYRSQQQFIEFKTNI